MHHQWTFAVRRPPWPDKGSVAEGEMPEYHHLAKRTAFVRDRPEGLESI